MVKQDLEVLAFKDKTHVAEMIKLESMSDVEELINNGLDLTVQ